MAVKIRLTRMGDKKSPFYRIVVADSRKSRDGKYIDLLGTFNPLTQPEEIKVNLEKANEWLKNGAQPTETARALLVKANVVFPEKKVKVKKEKKVEVKAEAEEVKETKTPAKKTTMKKTATKTTAKKPATKKAKAE